MVAYELMHQNGKFLFQDTQASLQEVKIIFLETVIGGKKEEIFSHNPKRSF